MLGSIRSASHTHEQDLTTSGIIPEFPAAGRSVKRSDVVLLLMRSYRSSAFERKYGMATCDIAVQRHKRRRVRRYLLASQERKETSECHAYAVFRDQ